MIETTKERVIISFNGLIKKYYSLKDSKDFISNEKQIQRSLIEPFVEHVLGWNTEEPSEFKVEAPAKGKKVDMLVCHNGITQFVIEAKSLTTDIKENN